MENKEKMILLEELLELDEGTLKEDMQLRDLGEWNSMASLSLIVLMDETFNRKIDVKVIKGFVTVKDILDYMDS